MKALKHIIVILILVWGTIQIAHGKSRIISASPDGNVFRQHIMNEWTVVLNGQWASDPYNQEQIALDLHFTSPDGKARVLPCYYVSGTSGKKSIWKARFAPRSLGENKLTFVLTEKGVVVAEFHVKPIDVQPSDSHGILHANDNWTFKFDDGTLFRGVGENICWELRRGEGQKFQKEYNDDGSRFNYGYMLHKLASLGGNFYRIWFTSNLVRGNLKRPEFNEAMMAKVDYMVRLSDSLGVHMMMALDAHGFIINWKRNRYNVLNGGPATTATEFFTMPECRRLYKNKIRFLIARYSYSPAIGCWEFFNEVDNGMYTDTERIPDEAVADWHREMSEYVKATDPYDHLVTTSISHRDVIGMNSIPTMDFNQKHIYCHTDQIPATIRDYSKLYGKPYVIGEEGYHWDWNLDFNTMVPGLIHDYKYALWLGMFSPTPILPMSWWWEFFEYHGTFDYLAIVSRMNKMMMDAAKGDFSCVDCAGSAESTALSVKAGEKIFTYIHNNNDTDFTAGFSIAVPAGEYALERFDTTTGEISSEGTINCNTLNILHLPRVALGPKGDVIFILTPLKE